MATKTLTPEQRKMIAQSLRGARGRIRSPRPIVDAVSEKQRTYAEEKRAKMLNGTSGWGFGGEHRADKRILITLAKGMVANTSKAGSILGEADVQDWAARTIHAKMGKLIEERRNARRAKTIRA